MNIAEKDAEIERLRAEIAHLKDQQRNAKNILLASYKAGKCYPARDVALLAKYKARKRYPF